MPQPRATSQEPEATEEMSRYRYSRYIPNPLDQLDLEGLLDRLKELFLQSGFTSRFAQGRPQTPTLEQLKRALAGILAEQPEVPEEWRDELEQFAEGDSARELSPEVDEFLDQVIQKLVEEGYLQPENGEVGPGQSGPGAEEGPAGPVRFELTDRGADFLGYRTLRELLGALGRSSFGRHDTNQLSTGVAADAASRPYEFGDTVNLDVNRTLLNAVQRSGKLGAPLDLEYRDLEVFQTEYQSSCATVLLLDCSHSMILYGEDRFTPAKKVALALAHLIRTQFPGDTLEVVLFHDSAEQIPISKLPSVTVGPYHTNTCEGLRLARRSLLNQRKDMRQIIMITDGKPSAITLPGGRIYKNSFGLDPMILEATFREVANCRRSGILINTFMVASDYYLVDFVSRVARICRGKAYFATTVNLAGSILTDFMTRKTKTVH